MNEQAFLQGFIEKCSQYGLTIKETQYLLEKVGAGGQTKGQRDRRAAAKVPDNEATGKEIVDRAAKSVEDAIKGFGGGANFVPGKVNGKPVVGTIPDDVLLKPKKPKKPKHIVEDGGMGYVPRNSPGKHATK